MASVKSARSDHLCIRCTDFLEQKKGFPNVLEWTWLDISCCHIGYHNKHVPLQEKQSIAGQLWSFRVCSHCGFRRKNVTVAEILTDSCCKFCAADTTIDSDAEKLIWWGWFCPKYFQAPYSFFVFCNKAANADNFLFLSYRATKSKYCFKEKIACTWTAGMQLRRRMLEALHHILSTSLYVTEVNSL